MTRIVAIARAVSALKAGPASTDRLAVLSSAGRDVVRVWMTQLELAGLVRRVGAETRPGQRGVKPIIWEWVP